MKKTFYTNFSMSNVHLTKDFGLLAYGMTRYKGYDSYLLTYENDKYENIDHIKGVSMKFIERRSKNFEVDSLMWILLHAKEIDVLNLYHKKLSSAVKMMLYKVLNNRGKVYLKYDAYEGLRYTSWEDRDGKAKEIRWKKPFYRYLIRHADVVSTELRDKAKEMSKQWHRKIIWVSNPYHPEELKPFKPFRERKDRIIVVGNMGTYPKGTETILDAFAAAKGKLNGYELYLVGSMTDEIHQKLENIRSDDKYLRDKILWHGEERDREKLIELYRDSKICVFPSRRESFGIVTVEAGMCGCFYIGSDIAPTRSITNQFQNCDYIQVDDVASLNKKLCYWTAHEAEMEEKAQAYRKFIVKQNSLERIIEKLESTLNSAGMSQGNNVKK